MFSNTTKSLASFAAGLCLAVPLLATTASADVRLRLSHPSPPAEIMTQAFDRFGEILEELAPGEFNFSNHPGGTLFKQGTEIPAMQRGNLEMNGLSSFEVAEYVPELSVFNAGYMFADYGHGRRVWTGEIGAQYNEAVVEKMGVRILAPCYLGTRVISIDQVRNAQTPEDLNGLKLRFPGSPDFLLLGEGLGIEPTPMPMSEVYLSMRTGVINGQDNPLTITAAAKIDEIAKEIVMTKHFVMTVFLSVAEPFYQELSPELQKALQNAASQACKINDEMRLADEAGQAEAFAAKGIVITEPDVEAFRKSVEDVYRAAGRYDDWSANTIAAINALR